jgi:hypothetical protein
LYWIFVGIVTADHQWQNKLLRVSNEQPTNLTLIGKSNFIYDSFLLNSLC